MNTVKDKGVELRLTDIDILTTALYAFCHLTTKLCFLQRQSLLFVFFPPLQATILSSTHTRPQYERVQPHNTSIRPVSSCPPAVLRILSFPDRRSAQENSTHLEGIPNALWAHSWLAQATYSPPLGIFGVSIADSAEPQCEDTCASSGVNIDTT